MAMMDTELSPGEAGELFDLRQARNVMGMVVRSVRRHWIRALAAFVSIFMAAVLVGYSTPKIFLSYSNLQLKPSIEINDIIAPNQIRSVSDPRAGVKETVLAQANLRAIVRELNLVADIEANKGLLSKVMGKIRPAAADPASQELDAIGELRSRIAVDSSTEPNKFESSISATWSDPVTAKEIVKRLQDNFIADRRKTEVQQIENIVPLLKKASDAADQRVEEVRNTAKGQTPTDLSAVDQADLGAAYATQSDANSKLENAKLTLQAAKTNFNSRYSVTTEPEVAKAPLNSRSKLYVLGFGAGALAALFLAAMADLLKGTFIESWQITRKLNVPVLAEVGE
jgi:uncharacterized protein involved in exopolysaccharide biosynthesis